MSYDLDPIFASDGLLSEHLPDYLPRIAQLQMAQQIQQSLQNHYTLLCEAGTGTGKTFAYLVPGILSGQQIIISTGTKNLQDQLYRKDLPVIASILEPLTQRQLSFSLLKGRSNYVCLYRFAKVLDEAWYDEQTQSELQIIKQTLGQTEFADRSEFSRLKEQSAVWPLVTSTAENCLGGACPDHEQCYVAKVREQAFHADIIVINHHLLMADLKLKTDALGELLPAAQAYIIDEAHQLPDIASHFFSRIISSQKIKNLLKEIRRSIVKTSAYRERFNVLSDDVRKLLDEMFMVLQRYKTQGSWAEIKQSIQPLRDEILFVLRKLKIFLEALAPASIELENSYKLSVQLWHDFNELTASTASTMVHWYECVQKNFTVNLTPLSIGEEFKQQLESSVAGWIFTSATLTVNSPEPMNSLEPNNSPEPVSPAQKINPQFSYFMSQLGLQNCATLKLKSPFDFSRQAILFAPQNLPSPNEEFYTRLMIQSVLPIVECLGGKTFFLFTSYRALHEAKEIFQNLDFNLFIQGDAPKQQLITQFKKSDRAVLLGTSSFWEGVDVKGKTLSCVVIDKLPFASPYEPVLQARINHLQQQGINAFYQYQLPQCAVSLQQGAGRLIRDVNDYGILVIADPRLFSKSYGYYLRKSLPEMPIESDLTSLQEKFRQMQQQYVNLE